MSPPACVECHKLVEDGPTAIACSLCLNTCHDTCVNVGWILNRLTNKWTCRNCNNKNQITCDASSTLNISHFNQIMSQLLSLGQEITTCNTNITDLKKVIDDQTVEINKCKNEIAGLKEDNNFLRSQIVILESKVDKTSPENLAREVRDRISRENNLIIFGLAENQNEMQDIPAAKDFLSHFNSNVDINISNSFRLGKFDLKKSPTQPRPLKIILQGPDVVKRILKNKNNIDKIRFPKLYIKSDNTQSQIQYLKNLRDELDSLKKRGEDVTIKYNNGIPEIVPTNSRKRNRNLESPSDHIPGNFRANKQVCASQNFPKDNDNQ